MASYASRRGGSLFGQRQGVPKSVRSARARKGHQKRASHLFVKGKAPGRKTTYRNSRGHLF